MTLVTEYSRYLQEPTLAGAIRELQAALRQEGALLDIDDAAAAKPHAPGKWSRKEILGHLLDSAVNNHQRFLRAQIPAHLQGGVLRIDGYQQEEWVRLQGYASRPWKELVALWVALNRHVLAVMDGVDRTKLGVSCVIGSHEPSSLEAVMVDYVGHVKHHLAQILSPARRPT